MDHYGYGLIRQGSGVWRSLRDGDFEEEDVWDALRDRRDNSGSSKFSKSVESSISVPKQLPTAARMIPRGNTTGRGSSCSSGSDSSQEAKVVQQSAPVNIPVWSKIRKNKQKKASKKSASPWLDDGGGGGQDDHDYDNDFDELVNGSDDDEEYSEGDGDGEYNCKVPPHEFIARRLARSHISSFSVFEGVGRTLKGRDLKKVRNAVLIKTGFLESP